MKYRKLNSLVRKKFGRQNQVLAWAENHRFIEVGYTILALPRGTYTIYSASGRGEHYQQVDGSGLPLIFVSEDAVCDYIWAQISGAPGAVRMLEDPSEPAVIPLERWFSNQKLLARAVLAAVDPVRADSPVAQEAEIRSLATIDTAEPLVDAVCEVLEDTSLITVRGDLRSEPEIYRAAYRSLAGLRPDLDSLVVEVLADRWISNNIPLR